MKMGSMLWWPSLTKRGDWEQEDENGWRCTGRTPTIQPVFVEHQDA